jgi:hypothetical protein
MNEQIIEHKLEELLRWHGHDPDGPGLNTRWFANSHHDTNGAVGVVLSYKHRAYGLVAFGGELPLPDLAAAITYLRPYGQKTFRWAKFVKEATS